MCFNCPTAPYHSAKTLKRRPAKDIAVSRTFLINRKSEPIISEGDGKRGAWKGQERARENTGLTQESCSFCY